MTAKPIAAVQKLPPILDIDAAPALLERLRGAVGGGRKVLLDAADVEAITSPCAQIILAACNSDDAVSVARPSAEFSAAFADLGLVCREAPADALEQVESEPSAKEPPLVGEPANEAALSSGAAAAAETDATTVSKRVLTIDDSRTIRDMLKLTLIDAGFEVLQGVDGEDGLNVLGDHPIDLVITDINMPKMDGYEVIRRLRGTSRHKTTPILVLTTESDGDKRNIARQAGATGWIVKPFDPDRLIETVRKVVP